MKVMREILYLLRNWKNITILVQIEDAKQQELERLSRSEYLSLCVRHQQRSPGSHHAEHNCDYCRLLRNQK